MRHRTGKELTGMPHSLGARIGVIDVSPEDDRKTVLTAILAEEKLKRTHIVLDLPQKNRALQRPEDFDHLKTLRRTKLQAELVFIIAPMGPGPAALALQRRFQVFPDVESFVRYITGGSKSQPAQSNKLPFFGNLFSSAKPPVTPVVAANVANPAARKPGTTPAARKPGTQRRNVDPAQSRDVENLSTAPVVARSTRPPLPPQTPRPEIEIEDIEDDDTGYKPASILENIVEADEDDTTAIIEDKPASVPDADPNVNPDEDPDELPPVPVKLPETPAAIDTTSRARRKAPSTPGTSSRPSNPPADPMPIVLGATPSAPKATGKTTKILPPAATAAPATPVAPLPVPVTPPATSRRNTGQMPAVVPAVVVADPVVESETANTVQTASKPNRGPSKPPTRPNRTPATPGAGRTLTPAGNISAISAGWPPRRAQPADRRRRPLLLIAIILLILLVLFGSGWFVLAKTDVGNTLGKTFSPSAPPSVTIHITPASKTVQDNYVMQGVTGNANPDNREVPVRQLNSTKTDTKQVNLTHVHQDAQVATGSITFFNGDSTSHTVTRATITFSVGNVRVAIDQDAVIPAANIQQKGQITVKAHVLEGGVAGNIGAAAISLNPCCGNSTLSAVNQDAFTGGKDTVDYNVLKPGDVTGVTNADQGPLKTNAQNEITGQKKASEQLLDDITCADPKTTPGVQPNVQEPTNVTTTNVTVSVSCNANVYDASVAKTIAQNALKQKVSKDPTLKGYVLAGNVVVTQIQPQIQGDPVVTFSVTAKGIWYYNWNDPNNKQALLNRIKGKSVKDAQTALNSHPGIDNKAAHPKIDINNGGTTLPSDEKQIALDIKPITGL